MQIASFLSSSGARVASVAGAPTAEQASATQEKAKQAYAHLKSFHQQKGWSRRDEGAPGRQ